MLCLSRRVGEELVVAERLRIRVLGITNGVVKLGFEGPREIEVKRSEIFKPSIGGLCNESGRSS